MSTVFGLVSFHFPFFSFFFNSWDVNQSMEHQRLKMFESKCAHF